MSASPKLIVKPGNKRDLQQHFGLGQNPNRDAVVAAFKNAANCPYYALPTVAKSQWQFQGPLSNANVNATLGDVVDILAGPGAGVSEIYQTEGLQEGEFQTYVLACAIGIHLEVGQDAWTLRGNALTHQTVAYAGIGSPDAWTKNDSTNNVFGLPGGATLHKAVMENNHWAAKAFWAMCRGYNARWSYGSLLNILDEQMRETAFCPERSSPGSASSSEVDAVQIINQTNQYYAGIGTGLDFAPLNAVRIGSVGTAPNEGRFAPSNDFDTIPVTFGGGDLRSMLKGNSEFRALDNPWLIKAGVKLGLKLEAKSALLAASFQQYFNASLAGTAAIPMDITQNVGIVTPGFTGTGASPVMLERTIDGSDVPQQFPNDTAVFKSVDSAVTMSIEILGYEVTDTIANAIIQDPTLKNSICSSDNGGTCLGWAA